jgi:two-component system LytT family response regulator
LLKPIDGEQLAEAVNRLSHIHLQELKNQVATYHHNQNFPDRQRVNFHTSDGIRLVNPDEVVRCSAESNYTMLYFSNNTRLLVSKPLKEIESLLSAFGFERIHKSYLINIKHLVAYLNKDNGCVQLSDGTVWPVSQRKKSYVLTLLKSRRSDVFNNLNPKDES